MHLKFTITCSLFLWGCFSLSAQIVHNLNSNSTLGAISLKSTGNIVPQDFLKEAKASRTFAINPTLQNARNVRVGNMVNLDLFEGKSYKATVTDAVTDVNGNFTLTLKLADYPMGFAIITTSTQGKSLVNVSIPELGQSFGNRYNGYTSENYLIEIDQSKVQRPFMGNDAKRIPQTRAEQDPLVSYAPIAGENPNTSATIDVLVVYTPAAANSKYASDHGGINNVISSMIALGNTCFSNSQTGITLHLAYSAQVSYTEDGDMNKSLNRLTEPSDGYMDNVHTLRSQHNADLVQLLSTDDGGGLAWILDERFKTGRYSNGFSVVNVTQVGGDYPCSVHEMGHNMGLGHGAQQTSVTSDGIFSYSKGWRWEGNKTNGWGNNYYTSVMSYQGDYYGDGKTSQYTSYFSNPNIIYLGAATGDATRADAARSLREMKHVIAYYSEIDKKLTVSPATCNFAASGGTSSAITITSDQSWTVSIPSSAASWLTASRISGSNNGTFTMTATANTATSSRNATVTVAGGGTSRTITVTQAGQPPFPIFNNLAGEYTQGASSVALSVPNYTFKVNGAAATSFNPNTKGTFLIDAVSSDGKTKIETYIIVK